MRGAIWLDRDCGNYGLNRCLQFTDEPIASPGKRFDKAWALRRVAEDLPDLVDGRVEVALDIDKSIRPQPLLQFLPRHHLPRPLQQNCKHLEWLPAELQLHAIFAQLARLHVCFKRAEAYKPRTGLCFTHWGRFFAVQGSPC